MPGLNRLPVNDLPAKWCGRKTGSCPGGGIMQSGSLLRALRSASPCGGISRGNEPFEGPDMIARHPAIVCLVAAAFCFASAGFSPVPETEVTDTHTACPDLSGCWSGRWCSRSTGHEGPMTAEFCRIGCDRYDVTFKGRFCLLIPFQYRAVLCATCGDDGRVHLSGSKRLGPLLGTFSFRGTSDGQQFRATYCSKDDSGTFTMQRCCP